MESRKMVLMNLFAGSSIKANQRLKYLHNSPPCI